MFQDGTIRYDLLKATLLSYTKLKNSYSFLFFGLNQWLNLIFSACGFYLYIGLNCKGSKTRGTQLRYSFTVLTTFASFTRKKMNRTAGANLTRLFFETFLTEKQTRKNPSLPNYPKEDNPPNSLPTILLRVLQHSKRT